MGYHESVTDDPKTGEPGDLKRRIERQEATLATYKESLEEIYSLYDTRLEELSFIRRLSDSLRISHSLKKVCLALLEVVMEELNPDRALLLLKDRRGRMRVKATADIGSGVDYWPDKSPIQGLAGEPLLGPLARVAQTGRPLLLPELKDGPGLLGGVRSLACLPLISRRETIGVFALASPAPGEFSQKEMRVLTITCDQAAAVLAGVRLINEVKRVNRAVRRSEKAARLALDSQERLLENANDLILTLDREGTITYVNRMARKLGYEPQSLIGRSLTELTALMGFEPERFQRSLGSPLEELELIDSQGRKRTALVSLTPMPPGTGHDPAWLVIARDITARKELERQLLHSEKLASVGLLAAGVAHEIGNPLSAISGYAQILKKGGITNESREEYAGAIEEQAGRIEKIIQDLLAYSRPSAGVRSLLRVNEACRSIVRMLTNQKLFRGIDVSAVYDPQEPLILMDRDQLAQVLINLLVNAAQALNGSGMIELSTRARSKEVLIRVWDDGPGIPEESAGRVFDPFFTTKEQGKGTGLGLATVHGVIKQSGGWVLIDSEPGCGSTFHVILPRAEGETEAGDSRPDSPPAALNRETILLVEDEAAVRNMTREVLELSGYQVIAAPDGQEALKIARAQGEAINLVLTDVVMPGLSGPELARELWEERPDLKVLFISGYTDKSLWAGQLDYEGTSFMPKPFKPAELVTRIRELLDQEREAGKGPDSAAEGRP